MTYRADRADKADRADRAYIDGKSEIITPLTDSLTDSTNYKDMLSHLKQRKFRSPRSLARFNPLSMKSFVAYK